jgi:hypothetical protein
MEKNARLTRGLALVGTFLMWIPLLVPVLLSLAALVVWRCFLFDFLMPAELFPLSILGFGLTLWAALRAHLHQKLIGWGFVIGLALLMLSQGIAIWTGLASGERQPTAQLLALVLVPYGMYVLALIASGLGGVWLTHDLYHSKPTVA